LRAERPQRGRLREFFQWNIDIIGVEDELADAEVIFCAVDYLRQVGLTADDIVVKISSRRMMAHILRSIGVAEDELDGLYAALDKRDKIPAEAFARMLQEVVTDGKVRLKINELMEVKSLDGITESFELSPQARKAAGQVRRLLELLDLMGLGGYCVFDMGTVRGLAYYTGIVFEIWDRAGDLRAVGGGGRYDNLLSLFGGPALPATGFGMGDCVLEILLRNKKLLEKQVPPDRLDFFVAPVSERFFDKAVELTMRLRSLGMAADFNYKALKLGKQLKQASDRNAAKCVIVGEEFAAGNELVVKDMATGEQRAVEFGRFLEENEVRQPRPEAR
jgi:histidyl-tRNA synthetase